MTGAFSLIFGPAGTGHSVWSLDLRENIGIFGWFRVNSQPFIFMSRSPKLDTAKFYRLNKLYINVLIVCNHRGEHEGTAKDLGE